MNPPPIPASLRAAEASSSYVVLSAKDYTYTHKTLAAIITRETKLNEVVSLLNEWVKDSECYCADHVAVKTSCAFCKTKYLLADLTK